MTDKQIHFTYGHRYPYAALLPSAGGQIEVNSEPNSRPEFGSRLDIRATAPQRDELPPGSEIKSEEEYLARTDLTQRGPMVDVLGPTIHFSIAQSRDLDLYAGYQKIEGFLPKEPVVVTLRTPYAIRLFPQPATRKWTDGMTSGWEELERKAAKGMKRAKRQLRYGPTLIGRLIDESPLPEYAIRLNNVDVPTSARWHRFAYLSSHHGSVGQMLKNVKADPQYWMSYELPPVERTAEIGVFGPLTDFESTAMRGSVITDGRAIPVGRGQDMSVHSDGGIATGHYQMTPLVSAGLPTERASITGDADVFIDGEPVNRLPVVPVLWGTAIVVFLGLLIEALVKWVFRRPHEAM